MAGFKGITVGHLNIRSINRKLEEVVRILSEGDIELLCITESWLNASVPDDMVSVCGYNLLRQDRTKESGKSTGGGLLVYYKNHLDVSLVEGLQTCTPNTETLWVKLSLKQTRPQYIGVVYRPPDGDLDISLELLSDQLTLLRSKGNSDQMTIGDINVNWDKKRDSKTKKLADFYKTNGLSNLIEGTTCHQNESESCIDHIAINRSEMFELHGIIELNASDHNLVYAVRKQPKIKHMYKFIWGRTFQNFNNQLFE